MKNITISVDDETYRQARIRAAEEGVSVSAMVRRFLQSRISRPPAAPPESKLIGLSETTREFRGPSDERGKLRLMEELWTSLSADEASYESPSWHRDVLEETAARHEAGDEKPLDWASAKRELLKRAE